MDRKELEKVSDFPLGEENVAFAPYFTGKSYISLLNEKEWSFIMLPLNLDAVIIGIFTMAADRS